MIRITVNGEAREAKDGITILELMIKLEAAARVAAVALNGEVVKKEAYDRTLLRDGDDIELLAFVGGG
ncbi:MAG: sulfur carrier protein ThiS [Helicobacteraceae bacterium]|nr:sulfur carrier protein ThiS [Helicobacteraceae bacterium]